jgi:hypothetical protein
MTYHPLSQDSGSSPEQRRTEATKLCQLLGEYLDELTERQRKFVEQMSDEDETVSTKQLFWLRDIWEKFA